VGLFDLFLLLTSKLSMDSTSNHFGRPRKAITSPNFNRFGKNLAISEERQWGIPRKKLGKLLQGFHQTAQKCVFFRARWDYNAAFLTIFTNVNRCGGRETRDRREKFQNFCAGSFARPKTQVCGFWVVFLCQAYSSNVIISGDGSHSLG